MYPSDPNHTGTSGVVGVPPSEDILMIRRCARCDRLYAPLTVDCASCASDSLEWVPSSGAGSILSWRVVDRGVIGGRGETTPLTVAVVELDEGPRMMTELVDCPDPGLLRAGMELEVAFRDGVPVFRAEAVRS